MTQSNSFAKTFLTLLVLLLFGGTAAAGIYGYIYIQKQNDISQKKDVELQELKESQETLKRMFAEAEEKGKSYLQENKQLKDESVKYETEKNAILNQVRTSVSSFETFRQDATAEIAKLKDSMADLENEKAVITDKYESVQGASKNEKDEFISAVKFLNKKIESHKEMQGRLVEHLAAKDRMSVVSETARLHYNLGNFYYRNANYDGAAREYRKSLFYTPDDRDANYNLAVVLDEYLGERRPAAYYYKKYLGLTPDAPNRQRILDRVLDLSLEDKVLDEPKHKKREPLFNENERTDLSSFQVVGDH